MHNKPLEEFVLGLPLTSSALNTCSQKDQIHRSRLLLGILSTVFGYPFDEYLQPGKGYFAYLREARRSPLVIRLDIAHAFEAITPGILCQAFDERHLNLFLRPEDRDAFIKTWCQSDSGGLIRGLAHSGWLFSQCMRWSLDMVLRQEVRDIFAQNQGSLPKLSRVMYSRYSDEVTLGIHFEGSRTLSVARAKEVGRFVAKKLETYSFHSMFPWNTTKTRVGCPHREPVWYSEKLGIGPQGLMIPRAFLEEVYRKTERLLACEYRINFWPGDPLLCLEEMLPLIQHPPLRTLTTKLGEHDPLRRDIWQLHGYHELIRQVYSTQRTPNREVRRLLPLLQEFRVIRKRIT